MKFEKDLSLIEVCEQLMLEKKNPQPINELINESIESVGRVADNIEEMTQLYVDITTSAKFVYCGDDEWDLKERQSVELWDKDGSFFNKDIIEEDEEDDGITADDYYLDDKPKYEDEEFEDEEVADDDDSAPEVFDEPEVDDVVSEEEEFLDEDSYNEIMDNYEDMYEDE